MIEIRKCTVADVLQEDYLLQSYGEESAIPGMPTPKAQCDAYRFMESTGTLHVFGAYLDTKLVGFISLLVTNLPHYGATVAMSESVFVLAEHRHTGAGMKLLATAKKAARNLNCKGLLMSAPAKGQLAKVLPNIGFTHTNDVFFCAL